MDVLEVIRLGVVTCTGGYLSLNIPWYALKIYAHMKKWGSGDWQYWLPLGFDLALSGRRYSQPDY